MLLIYHLDSGHTRWSPSNAQVQASMKRIKSIIEERCSIRVEIPSSHGGTSTTGNVARDCFMSKREFLKWAACSIDPVHKSTLEIIQTDLSVSLRLVNSGDQINSDNCAKEHINSSLVSFHGQP